MAKFTFSAFADEAGSSLGEQIALLKDNGINYIEPRNIDGKPILTLTEEELYAVKAELDKNGIKVNSLGSPIGKYPIDDDFDTHLIDFEKALRACEILGTDRMRMFSFYVTQDRIAEVRDEVIRRMTVMADIAEARGITLCHENESAIFGLMPSEVRDILTSIPRIKGIFDPANYRMNNADVIDGIEATLINLSYLHIKDAIFDTQMIVPAGEGEGRIGEIIDIVNDRCDGLIYLTLEPHLFLFDAYKMIDEHDLKGKYKFRNNREAFDFAIKALEKLMSERGYRKDENGIWEK
ncbi:MAG: sugar phosphate isomerase/epimerase [Clostridia bacterium]|nr:sugar phosphate isomerase/epimerase [Clostridia bacterium]